MNICLFTEDEIGKPLAALDERAVHLNKVLHKKVGDTFSAGIIGGQAGIATITKTQEVLNSKNGKFDIQYEYSFKGESDGKPLYPLIMIIGFPRPIQLKRLLRDVAALGVSQVHLTGTELGEKSYMQSTLVERGAAYQMLLDGTVQAASTHVPELFLHSSLAECLEAVLFGAKEKNCSLKKLALDNVRPTKSLQSCIKGEVNNGCSANVGKEERNTNDGIKINADCQKCDGLYVAAIGSERGWTDRERDLLCRQGFTLCSMGRRVMRTETAATVSASIILSNLGLLD